MTKKITENQKKNLVFVENSKMETQTVFLANGNINIYPCNFELGHHIVAGGKDTVSQKGRMVTEDDGTSHFRAYRKDSGARYAMLMQTEHGEMKTTQGQVKICFNFPKRLSANQVARMLLNEVGEMVAWMDVRGNNAKWE